MALTAGGTIWQVHLHEIGENLAFMDKSVPRALAINSNISVIDSRGDSIFFK